MSKTLCFEYLQTQFTERSGYAANKDRKNLSDSYSWVKKYIDCNIKDYQHFVQKVQNLYL